MTPEVADRLTAYVARNRRKLAALHSGMPTSQDEVAAELASDVEFAEVGLCSFWRDPRVEEVREVLLSVPDPYGLGIPADLLATAMALACSKRVRRSRIAALVGGTAGTGLMGWVIAKGIGGSRD
jgi:hypothetical protein